MEPKKKIPGRPPLDKIVIEDIKSRLRREQDIDEIVRETGVSQAKVYEVKRYMGAQAS